MHRMRLIACALGAGLLFWTSAARALDAEWPGWRGPNRDGKSPDKGLLKEWPPEGPRRVWQADGIGKGFSSVAVSGGMVYISGQVDRRLMISAFDLGGKAKWKIEHGPGRGGPEGSRGTPVIDGGKLYLISGAGLVGCYAAPTGKRLWTREMKEFGGRSGGWGYAESVLIYEDWAIVKPGGKNCVAALNKATGETVWTSTGFSGGPEYSSCLAFVYEGKPLIVTGTRSGLVCFDAKSGVALWSNRWSAGNTANCPTPVYSDGYVFWANGYGRGGICMKLKADGDAVAADAAWTTRDMVCHHGGFVIHEGHIYGNHGGGWACLDLRTGEKKWSARGVGKGSLCFADGMLYLFGEGGGQMGLATCSPEGMEMKGRFSVKGRGPSWAHPVVIGGRLYLRYDDNLYCFDVQAK